MSIDFFTRLPLHGETQFVPRDARNRGDWHGEERGSGAVSNFAVGDPFTYIDYLSQIARAAEINGFSGVLMVNSATGEEPWTVCSLLARETKTLRFVTAFHPAHLTPWNAAQMAATYQRASGNRLVWNIINGGSDAVQRQVGDFLAHDERYARASEWLDVVKGYFGSERFEHEGRYFRSTGGGLRGPLRKAELPLICTAGSSEPARELGAKHADYYLLRAEHPEEVRKLLEDVRARAARHDRHPIRFGMSIDVIARPSEEEARAEAARFFAEGLAKGAVQNRAAASTQRTARRLSYEHEFGAKERADDYADFFIYDNVWSGFGFIGIPPGCALVGSYENVVARIREYNRLGIELFFLAGYPHLEEAYRLGEHVLPHFRGERAAAARARRPPSAR
ncbi:MAG: LLM class flavin-dependent oxidoreductase [Polyangiaceae bacterium]